MATAHRGHAAPQAQTREREVSKEEAAELLMRAVEAFTPSEKTKVVYDALTKKIETVRDLLCDQLKPHAERFVKRAMMTFQESSALMKCTPASFIKCVLKAAECGLAIDGKLGYAVSRNNSKKGPDGQWFKVAEASFQPSYIGVIAVAKRTGKVLAVYGDTVCENDVFEYERRTGQDHFVHRRAQLGTPRGKVLGAYQKLILPGGLTHIEVMDIEELNRIMESSESYKHAQSGDSRYGGGKKDSVWHKHTSEMQKKTVVHRALKTYQDDPGLMVALSAIEDDYEHGEPAPYASTGQGRVGRSTINDMLTPVAQPQWPAQGDDPFAGEQGPQDAYDGSDADPEPEAPQPPAASHGAIAGILRGCKTRKELDDNWTTFLNAQSDGYEPPVELEALYAERREILPADKGGKQKSLVE